MTPQEFQLTIEALTENKRDHINDLIFLAWHIEAFARTKKLPRLKSLIKTNRQNIKQTDEQMFEIVKTLNTIYGGDVV